MKKIQKYLIAIVLIIIIPYLIVTILIKDEEIKFKFVSNMMVRVKQDTKEKIVSVPFEEYITGVLAGEMPTNFEMEALKAQAVAARSYVMKKMEQNANKEYDVVDTVSNQVYLDETTLKEKWKDKYVEKINKIKKAIIDTKGEYMTYDNQVIEAFFFSTSSGKTENVEEVFSSKLPYLRSVDSSWDEEVSPVFHVKKDLSLADFYTKLNLPYKDTIKTEVIKTTSTGRVKEIKINDQIFTGSDAYSKLGLRSTFFEIKQIDSNVQIDTKGYGHGVGMSQYGALAMAKKGYQYEDILKHYYQGIEISKI